MLLLVGSAAAIINGCDIRTKPLLDLDFIGTQDSIDNFLERFVPDRIENQENRVIAFFEAEPSTNNLFGSVMSYNPRGDDLKISIPLILEFEIASPGSTGAELLEMPFDRISDELYKIATIDELLFLKLSHRYKKNSTHFSKTMRDIKKLREFIRSSHARDLKSKTNTIMAQVLLNSWFKRRERETLNHKHPKLIGESKDAFFDAKHGVQYVYDHDAIHRAVAHLDEPAYSKYQPAEAQVETSREMFESLPKTVRLLGVLEESYVLSLERSIIPHDLWKDKRKCQAAFRFALEKVCTSITSGWFREFAWENFDTVIGMYDMEYVERFKNLADSGKVEMAMESSK